ncbi:MAG: hypothetical protein ACI3XW_09375 [Butyricicoccus sp.]
MAIDIGALRQTCKAGEVTTFLFDLESSRYVVKNYTPATIFVCLGEWDDSKSTTVSTYTAHTIFSLPGTAAFGSRATSNMVTIKAEKEGMVEVLIDL